MNNISHLVDGMPNDCPHRVKKPVLGINTIAQELEYSLTNDVSQQEWPGSGSSLLRVCKLSAKRTSSARDFYMVPLAI